MIINKEYFDKSFEVVEEKNYIKGEMYDFEVVEDKVIIDTKKEEEAPHVAYWFDKLWGLIPDCIEKSALGGEKLMRAFKPIVIEMRKHYSNIPQTDTLKKEDWEERFENQFKHCFNIGVTPDDITKENIKHFITQEIAKAKEGIVKRAKHEKFTVIKKPSGWFRGEHEIDLISYNIACDDIIQLIQNNK